MVGIIIDRALLLLKSESSSTAIDRGVTKDRQQPITDVATSWIKTRGPSPDGQERFLYDIFGLPLIAEDAIGQAIRQPAVAIVQLAQRLIILLL